MSAEGVLRAGNSREARSVRDDGRLTDQRVPPVTQNPVELPEIHRSGGLPRVQNREGAGRVRPGCANIFEQAGNC